MKIDPYKSEELFENWLASIDGKKEIDRLDAPISYYKSHFEDVPAKEKTTIREALEKYCELDTYAEIILVDGLKEICEKE